MQLSGLQKPSRGQLLANARQHTSSRRADEKHADFLSRDRSDRACGALLKALDARVEIANDIL